MTRTEAEWQKRERELLDANSRLTERARKAEAGELEARRAVGLLPRLNGIYGRGYDKAPGELKPVIMAVSKLEHKARTARQKKDQAHG